MTDWANDSVPVSAVPIAQQTFGGDDWSATDTGDWAASTNAAAAPGAPAPAAAAAAPANEWGGAAAENWN